jgi:hypothetical protein
MDEDYFRDGIKNRHLGPVALERLSSRVASGTFRDSARATYHAS